MAKTFKIKEIFYTIQGEGAQAGRPAVFVRFSGCNLWSGREEDRASAVCRFCDTDFRGTDGENGGTYSASQLAEKIVALWNRRSHRPFIVMTGGEPLLQVTEELIQVLHENNIEIAIETNGTIEVPDGIDWVCVSPKANSKVIVQKGDELKIVFPQPEINPVKYESWDFKVFSIQPMYSEAIEENTASAVAFCMEHPKWKLSIQSHKILGLP